MQKKVLVINSFGLFSTNPPYATAYITSLLRKHKHEVKHIDANAKIWNYILSQGFIDKLNKQNPSIFSTFFINTLKVEIEYSKSVLKDEKRFYNPNELLKAIEGIEKVLNAVEKVYNVKITPKQVIWDKNIGIKKNVPQRAEKRNFSHSGNKLNSLKHIDRISSDEQNNLFYQLYFESLSTHLFNYTPDIVIIETLFPWEITQLSTMAKWIKKIYKTAQVCFSGFGFDEMHFIRIAKELRQNNSGLFGFDAIFLLRNDKELLKYINLEQYERNLNIEVGNILYINKGEVIETDNKKSGAINNTVIPDYSDLDYHDYLTPELVFYEHTNSKCYWSKCNFCSINTYKPQYKVTDDLLVVKRLQNYIEMQNCKSIVVFDEAFHPKTAEKLSDELILNNIKSKWSIRTRIDEGYSKETLKKIHKAGCRELWIGLESASPSILNSMNKSQNSISYLNPTCVKKANFQ